MASANKLKEKGNYLEGQLLIATPSLRFSCFERSVIYLCVHNEGGAMGIIINQTINDIKSSLIWDYFKIDTKDQQITLPVHFGGPVESARGFILHSDDYKKPEALHVRNGLALSSNLEILKDISSGAGPENKIFALGYAGWGPNQLESEIEANSWISVPATRELVFGTDNSAKWNKAAKSIGVDLYKFSSEVGHA